MSGASVLSKPKHLLSTGGIKRVDCYYQKANCYTLLALNFCKTQSVVLWMQKQQLLLETNTLMKVDFTFHKHH